MKKKFVLFTIKKRAPLSKKILKTLLNILPIIIIAAAFVMKIHYIIVAVLLFGAFMLRKVFKVQVGEQIEVYYDYLIFSNPYKQVELDFYHIHHIDIEVAEGIKGNKYIKELVLLDYEEKELLSIDGERYEKEQLEYLANHIINIQSVVTHRF